MKGREATWIPPKYDRLSGLFVFQPMAEAIQQLILEVLDKNETIKDTRELILPGQSAAAATQDDQLAIIAALNSLLSRNVIDPLTT